MTIVALEVGALIIKNTTATDVLLYPLMYTLAHEGIQEFICSKNKMFITTVSHASSKQSLHHT